MIAYDRDTEYLSKLIYKTITPTELKAVAEGETAHRKPGAFKFRFPLLKLLASGWNFLSPYRIAHDLTNGPSKPAPKT